MSLADYLHDLTLEALKACSEQQRVIYRLVHGITETGTIDVRSLESVARTLDLSRSAARWHLAMAELAIYRHIARCLIADRLEHDTDDLPGADVIDHHAAHGISVRSRDKQTYTNIHLGEGSSEVMRASRIGCSETRQRAYEEIHERRTRRPSDA